MSFAAGLLDGIANGVERKKASAERERELSIMELAAKNGAGFGQISSGTPGGYGEAAGRAASASYDGKISDRPAHAYQRFVAAGIPDHVAAGLVGNMMQESGTDINPAAVGDNGNAFGAPQWNGPRRHAYLGYAAKRGVDPTDFDAQIDYLLHEGQTSEKDAWGRIMSAKSAEEAAVLGSRYFWRPGAPHNENRAAYARRVFETRPQAAAPASEPAQQPTTWRWFQSKMNGGAQ